MKYVYALDLSLSNMGVAIFDKGGNIVKIMSKMTHPKSTTGRRLQDLLNFLIDLDKEYKAEKIIIEQGFTQFNTATQQLYRVHGVINCLFAENEQIYYAPTTIKKIITGNGKADKKEVQNKLLEWYPGIKFKNNDESDAVAIGLTYFVEKVWKK